MASNGMVQELCRTWSNTKFVENEELEVEGGILMYEENLLLITLSISRIGAVFGNWLGSLDVELQVLVLIMAADYATGVLAAFKRKRCNSEVMFWGVIRKASVMIVIVIAIMLDELLGNNAPIFRMLALYFYIAREGLSVVDNIGHLGVPLPHFIRFILERLQLDSESKASDPKPLQVMDPSPEPTTLTEESNAGQENSGSNGG